MLGAIIGDIAGSTFEFNNVKTMDFPLFATRRSMKLTSGVNLLVY